MVSSINTVDFIETEKLLFLIVTARKIIVCKKQNNSFGYTRSQGGLWPLVIGCGNIWHLINTCIQDTGSMYHGIYIVATSSHPHLVVVVITFNLQKDGWV